MLACGILFLTVTPRKREIEEESGALQFPSTRSASGSARLTLKQALQRVAGAKI
jgi:hypothetical protein